MGRELQFRHCRLAADFMVQRAGVAIMGLSAYHRVQRDSHTMQLILGHRLRGLSTLILAYAKLE